AGNGSPLAVDNAIERRADLGSRALLELMAGGAGPGARLSLFRVGLGEALRQRRNRGWRGASLEGGLFGCGQVVTGLCELRMGEHGVTEHAERHHEEKRAEKSAGNLVEFEGVHFPPAAARPV